MRRANQSFHLFSPFKSKQLVEQLSISQKDFKVSLWQWFSRFRERRGLQQLFLHGEEVEVDKDNPNLLGA